MITHLAQAARPAGISPVAGAGLSLATVAVLGGLVIAMHHKGKSPRIIGWICFVLGIPLAGLLSGFLGGIAGFSLWSVPVSFVLTGYVAFVFLHDGFRRSRGGGNAPHRWLQPVFGLILPSLMLTLGGGLGSAVHSVFSTVNHGVTSTVSKVTGNGK